MTGLPQIGAFAGWHLDFRKGTGESASRVCAFASADYYASIDATLPGELDGGSYTFVIEGVSNEDFAELWAAREALLVRLHLYWRDASVTSYFVDLAGLSDALAGDEPAKDSLVAVLRVTALKRRAGSRRYEVVVEAHEWAYEQLLQRLQASVDEPDELEAAAKIANDPGIDVPFKAHGTLPPPQAGTFVERRRAAVGDVAIDRLRQLGWAMERRAPTLGLGVYVIRDGVVHAGPERLAESPAVARTHELTPDNGLIEIEARGQELADPNWVYTPTTRIAPMRDRFELTLRGRPDIKPGDFVKFSLPADALDDARASLTADPVPAGGTVRLYVRGVTHRLARERGFATTVRGVVAPTDQALAHARTRQAQPTGTVTAVAAAHDDSPDGALASALRRLAEEGGGQRIDVGQVRAANVRDTARPNQTAEVWRGLLGGDGAMYGAARLDFDGKGMTRRDAVPYAAPFAWGKFGLVLPRYPGMRVLVAHRLGDGDDPVEVGALWERGQAPESLPGDYWLILPAAIAPEHRERVGDTQKPEAPTGRATNDLIDADGNRVIEVGKLTVRVGTNLLGDGGTRPQAAAAHVHIEHQSGAKILIDEDGNVTIRAKNKLHLVAEDDITLDTPKNVIVKTDGFMDVRGRS